MQGAEGRCVVFERTWARPFSARRTINSGDEVLCVGSGERTAQSPAGTAGRKVASFGRDPAVLRNNAGGALWAPHASHNRLGRALLDRRESKKGELRLTRGLRDVLKVPVQARRRLREVVEAWA